jgi:hypothetical protein
MFAPLIPLGVSLTKIRRNSLTEGNDGKPLTAQATREQGVLDRLTAGGGSSPLAHWSEQHLERMIKHNSVFKANADKLRSAHADMQVGTSGSRRSSKESTGSIPATLVGA